VIEDNNMSDNYHGIYLVNSGYTNASGNNITDSDIYSLFVHNGTTNSEFRNNLLSGGREGVRIRQRSGNNIFENNTVFDHTDYGVYSTYANDNLFGNNFF